MQEKAINIINKINYELKKIQIGKWYEVNKFDLPGHITPEFIYGYDEEERKSRFFEIISVLFKERDKILKEINNKLNALKNIPKDKLKFAEPMAKSEIIPLEAEKDRYSKKIFLLKEKFQNKWVPAPLFLEREEDILVQKINDNIPYNTLRIIFGKTNYIKKKLYLIVKLPNYSIEKSFEQKAPGDWSNQIDFEIFENYYELYNSRIEVDIFKKKFFKEHHSGKIIINLDPLKYNNEFFESECKIELDSKREGIKCCIGVKIRKSLREKEYIRIRKINYFISKVYPQLKVRGSNSIESIKTNTQIPKVIAKYIKTINSTVDKEKAPVKTPEKNPIEASVVNQDEEKEKQITKIEKQIGGAPSIITKKKEFSEEELKDPDYIDNLNSLMVLEFKLKKYEDIRNNIDGRTPKELMERIIKIKFKKSKLTELLGNSIGPKDYLLLLKINYIHDKKLLSYFNQIKDSEKSELVSERLPLLIKETHELRKQMQI